MKSAKSSHELLGPPLLANRTPRRHGFEVNTTGRHSVSASRDLVVGDSLADIRIMLGLVPRGRPTGRSQGLALEGLYRASPSRRRPL